MQENLIKFQESAIQDRRQFVADALNSLKFNGVIGTQKEFAALLGFSESSISKALKGDERFLTDSLISKIVAYLKVTGTAPVLETQDKPEMVKIIPTEALAGTLADYADSVQEYECERMVSPIKGADLAIKIFGDSMSPEYPSGSMLLIKKVNEKAFIEWGKVYVLDTENGAVIKQIRRTDRENVVECVSLNPAFQPFTIDTSYIKGWYRILMMISLK
jgi:phage repressor protein C with HTH and peptisase S24 domain